MVNDETASTYLLGPSEASFAAEILLRLADLFDGGGQPLTEDNKLFMKLHPQCS